MSDKLIEKYLDVLKEVENLLSSMNFLVKKVERKGFAVITEYKRGNTSVRFLFGPSDWDIEMIVSTAKGKFTLGDLFQFPAIRRWVEENRYESRKERSLHGELMWNLELLKISLPLIE